MRAGHDHLVAAVAVAKADPERETGAPATPAEVQPEPEIVGVEIADAPVLDAGACSRLREPRHRGRHLRRQRSRGSEEQRDVGGDVSRVLRVRGGRERREKQGNARATKQTRHDEVPE